MQQSLLHSPSPPGPNTPCSISPSPRSKSCTTACLGSPLPSIERKEPGLLSFQVPQRCFRAHLCDPALVVHSYCHCCGAPNWAFYLNKPVTVQTDFFRPTFLFLHFSSRKSYFLNKPLTNGSSPPTHTAI